MKTFVTPRIATTLLPIALGAQLLLCPGARAADATRATETALALAAIPFPLAVENVALSARIVDGQTLELTAPGQTNLFNSPDGKRTFTGAPMVLFKPDRDFVLTAKVGADLKSVYDVAALVVYENSGLWAKFCFENSVRKQPTIISVVTRGVSDDCNALPVDGSHVYLALVRKGGEFALHYSADGRQWQLIRHFQLGVTDAVRVGFAAHGSGSSELKAEFSEIAYSTTLPKGLRDLNKR